MGNLNARVGNYGIQKIIGTFGEETINDNGKLSGGFTTYNNLKITNTFFRKKDMHKYTWISRGFRSIIDYVIVNNKLAKPVRH
jgi:hypothetical protein